MKQESSLFLFLSLCELASHNCKQASTATLAAQHRLKMAPLTVIIIIVTFLRD